MMHVAEKVQVCDATMLNDGLMLATKIIFITLLRRLPHPDEPSHKPSIGIRNDEMISDLRKK